MGNESGVWIMRGIDKNDPDCIHNVCQLEKFIDKVGFLPLFKNEIEGFSVEEHTVSDFWWSGDEERDPWEWRKAIAAGRKIAYGKFFDKKAGFISKKWLPHFINYRRDGYDFDARWEDAKAQLRQKHIMDVFGNKNEILSNELKISAGFGKGGDKNFDGVLTSLQSGLYLCVCDFKQRKNKSGEPYGWHIAAYSTPEHIFGEEFVAASYNCDPEISHQKITEHMKKLYPAATEKQLRIIDD